MRHNQDTRESHSKPARHGRGPSSYWMHDPEEVFRQLALNSGDRFLDLGCGPGDYSLRAARIVGPEGRVYAVDKWELAFNRVTINAMDSGYEHLEPVLADINQRLPIKDRSIDLCFICTVLHTFPWPKFQHKVFGEIKRVLKPHGRLAIIECKKEDQPWGPPKHMRISPVDNDQRIGDSWFQRHKVYGSWEDLHTPVSNSVNSHEVSKKPRIINWLRKGLTGESAFQNPHHCHPHDGCQCHG